MLTIIPPINDYFGTIPSPKALYDLCKDNVVPDSISAIKKIRYDRLNAPSDVMLGNNLANPSEIVVYSTMRGKNGKTDLKPMSVIVVPNGNGEHARVFILDMENIAYENLGRVNGAIIDVKMQAQNRSGTIYKFPSRIATVRVITNDSKNPKPKAMVALKQSVGEVRVNDETSLFLDLGMTPSGDIQCKNLGIDSSSSASFGHHVRLYPLLEWDNYLGDAVIDCTKEVPVDTSTLMAMLAYE